MAEYPVFSIGQSLHSLNTGTSVVTNSKSSIKDYSICLVSVDEQHGQSFCPMIYHREFVIDHLSSWNPAFNNLFVTTHGNIQPKLGQISGDTDKIGFCTLVAADMEQNYGSPLVCTALT